MSGIGGIGGMSPGAMRGFQPPSFESLDSNSDGGISLDELKSNAPGGASDAKSAKRAEELFSKLDSDGDGTVTSDEKDAFDSEIANRQAGLSFSAQQMAGDFASKLAENIVSALDGDGDGGISLDELKSSGSVEDLDESAIEELFATIDEDGDGTLSTEETASFLKSNKPDGPPPPPPPGGPGGPNGAGGPPPDAAESEDEDDSQDSFALDMLSAAISAYQSSATASEDLTETLLGTLNQAA